MAVQREVESAGLHRLQPEDVWTSLDDESDASPAESRRSNSAIQFPYGDLNDAVEVARAMYANAGSSGGTWEQIAAWLGYASISSGAFRTKVATARIFGLTETKSGGATLTSLGVRILDPARERAARAQAFLTVPLYRAIYESYRGIILPPDTALEQEMVQLGVSRKQRVRARQIFQRAADQAGFFGLGRNKLVMPHTEYAGPFANDGVDQLLLQAGGVQKDGKEALHPLLVGLLHTLPAPGRAWPKDKRQHWLTTADHILALLYPETA